MTSDADAAGRRFESGWHSVKLPEVVFFQEGPGLRKWQWADSGMKVINGTNILEGGEIDTSNTDRFISLGEFQRTYSHFAINEGDIVVSSSGTIGKVGRIKAEHLPMMMNTSVIRFRSADKTRLHDGYLFAFLRSRLFLDQVRAVAIGAAQANFGPSHLKEMSIPLPGVEIQHRISSILSAYDELIENGQRRILILEQIARAIYREWFVKFRFPGHEKISRVASPLGEIPQGWDVVSLDAVCERVTDGSHFSPKSVEKGLPMASSKDMHKWGLNLDTCRFIGRRDFDELVRSGCKPEKDDILITKDGANYLKHIFVNRAEQDVVLLSSVAILRPAVRINPHLLAAILSSPENKERLKSYVTGAAIPRIVLKDFKQFRFVLPSVAVQSEWVVVAEPLTVMCWQLIDQLQNLRQTRDLLLPRLISGQVKLTDSAA